MIGNGKMTSLLTPTTPDLKKIVKYGRSKKLDVIERLNLATSYFPFLRDLDPDYNPLHSACICCKPKIVSALIEKGYDVKASIGNFNSYLNTSLHYGNIPVAYLLLSMGAVVNATNNEGKTPMQAALSKRHKKMKTCVSAVSLLLEAGVSVNAVIKDSTKQRPLHIAVRNNIPKAVSFLLQKGADGNIADAQGSTPLHHACSKNFVGIIKLLTLHKVDLYKHNDMDETPLLVAVRRFFKNSLRALIDCGCDINKVVVNGSTTALHYAVKDRNLDKVKYLVSLGADTNKQLSDGKTPLHTLANNEEFENVVGKTTKTQATSCIFTFLVENGANVNVKDCQKNTPLSLAVSQKNLAVAKKCITEGADVNFRLASGKTIFHSIAALSHDIIVLALKYGGDYSIKDESNMTPFHVAIISEVDVKFIKSFVEFGCPYNQDNNLWNRIQEQGSDECIQFFKAEEQFFKGIKENNVSLVRNAVEAGAVPTGCSEDCRYPIHYLAFNGYRKPLTYLLENACQANNLNDRGESALYVAARQGHYDICCILLKYGACYNHRIEQCSLTPKAIAVEFGQKEIAKLLRSVGRMFRLAKTDNDGLVKELMAVVDKSESDYLMYANSINAEGSTLLAITLDSKKIANANLLMKTKSMATLKSARKR